MLKTALGQLRLRNEAAAALSAVKSKAFFIASIQSSQGPQGIRVLIEYFVRTPLPLRPFLILKPPSMYNWNSTGKDHTKIR
jgi:hypothetical protein